MGKKLEILIERLANNGKGVGTGPEGKTVFVAGAVPGDRLLAEVTAEKKRLREAVIREIIQPSPERIAPDCPDNEGCGGCAFRCMTYTAELTAKEGFVRDAFRRIGGFTLSAEGSGGEGIRMDPILPSPRIEAYRNKVEFAIGTDAAGEPVFGFRSEQSHRVIPVRDCRIIPSEFLKAAELFCKVSRKYGLKACDPASGTGSLRHLVLRRSGLTGEIMAVIVSAAELPHEMYTAAEEIRQAMPEITSVILNINPNPGGAVLGPRNRVLSGAPVIRDRIRGVPVEIGPLSFFQVNTPAAERLYQTTAEFAAVRAKDVVLDLYCGMGTIGLSIASGCRRLIGGEIIPEAVESARRNARAMGVQNTRFLCGDAGQIAEKLIDEGLRPNLIILDPPRRGCSPETLKAVQRLSPDRIVMVSCDPATAARDCRTLTDQGYTPTRLQPVDLFPRTKHVETVCCLYHQKNDFISVPYEPKDADYLKQLK